jgi:hypothetical protein
MPSSPQHQYHPRQLGAALTGTVFLSATHTTVAGNGAAALDYGFGHSGPIHQQHRVG